MSVNHDALNIQGHEVLTRFTEELRRLLDRARIEREQLEDRVRALEEELSRARGANQALEQEREAYRREVQRLRAAELTKDIDPLAWENFDPNAYSLTINDLLAGLEGEPE